jgi:hypothetical protein
MSFPKVFFSNHSFHQADILSMASKVSVELAYPCIRIPWRYGRRACTNTNQQAEAPSGAVNTTSALNALASKFKMTMNELAILTAGAHGLANASCLVANSGFFF